MCDPVARPGVVAFARLMTSHYRVGSTALMGRTCGSGPSEHYDGRAWDWMLNVNNPAQEAIAQSVLAWLTAPDAHGVKGAMARRFGIMYIIHNRKMWRSYATERGWAPYYGSSPHTDHIHFSFNYDGAAGRTSWWTGVPTTSYLTTLPRAGTTLPTATHPTTPPIPTTTKPVPATPVVLRYGMTTAAVKALQARLGALPTTGYYGPATRGRVTAYQRFAGLPQTGIADLHTQEVLAARGWKSATTAYPTLQVRHLLGRGQGAAGEARWAADDGQLPVPDAGAGQGVPEGRRAAPDRRRGPGDPGAPVLARLAEGDGPPSRRSRLR